MSIKLLLHLYIFSPPFVLLQYEYLDIVVNATQQDLLVNRTIFLNSTSACVAFFFSFLVVGGGKYK